MTIALGQTAAIVGERRHLARVGREMITEQLSDESGVSGFEIKHLELGIDDPKAEPIVLLCTVFEVEPSFFINGPSLADLN